MLTKRLDIVYALPPKRTRRKKAAPADMKVPVMVEARDSRRIKRKPALATRIVDHSTPDMPDDKHHQRGEAADRLWQTMVENVKRHAGVDPTTPRMRANAGHKE
jgi:hypothetical protein